MNPDYGKGHSRTSDQQRTYKGRLVQAVVRFIGPVLLALALLSIRGCVKR